MNQIRTVSCVAFISLALGGCAPLQQAPLVYSSKVAVGLDVSATSTEAPGVGVNIGYKQVDAAYVPVAVAKKCESTNFADCKDDNYKLLKLYSTSGQRDTVAPSDAAITKANNEVDKASALVTEKSAAIDLAMKAYDEDKKLSDGLALKKKVIENLTANGRSDSDEFEKAQSEAKIAEAASERLAARKDAITRAISARDDAIAAAAKASKDVKELVQEKLSTRNDKHDAFSVFGTFSANAVTSVGSDKQVGANLQIGKVFSTGVASQNLTEGMKAASSASAFSTCLINADNLASKITDPTKKADSVSDLIALCKQYALVDKKQ